MTKNTIFEQIGEMIGNDELQAAIYLLQKLLKDSPKLDEAIIQSARYNDVMKQIRLGLIDVEKANFTKNQIRFGLLDLLREIDDISNKNKEISLDLAKINFPEIGNFITQYHSGSGDNIAGNVKIINK